MKNSAAVIIQLLGLVVISNGFHMIKVDPGLVSVQPGEQISLLCAVDSHWEYCRFYTPNGKDDCDFEWKRAVNGVRMQNCDIADRATFSGDYEKKQCGITIKNMTAEDSGVWVCHMEEYVFLGGRGSGRTVEAKINITVEATTTPAPPPPSTTPLPTPARAPSTPASSTSSTEVHEKDLDVHHEMDADVHDGKAGDVQGGKAGDVHDGKAGDVPEAVPRVEEADSTTPIVIGVLCAVLLVGALVVGAMFIHRRRQTRDSSAAAVVYEREARAVHDQRSMVNGRRSSEMSYRDSAGNYHEFFPPHISVTGATGPESQA